MNPLSRSRLRDRDKRPRLAKKPSVWRMLVWSPIGFVLILGVLEAINLLFLRARDIWIRH